MNSKKIKNRTSDTSKSKAVKVAGFMFLFAFIVPTLNWTFLLSGLNVSDNVIATANNIITNELLFRFGISVELIMSIGLIVLGLALYIIHKQVNKSLALLALLIKVTEATLAAVLVLISFISLQFITGSNFLTVFTPEQLQAPVGFLLRQHTALYAIPMVFLGLDMMIFSYLFFKSKYIPEFLAGFGILSFALIFIHALMFILAPEFATVPINQIIFWAPSGLFEIIIGIWLLSKGIKVQSQDVHASKSAKSDN